jgi:hypothetical protein
MKFASIAVLSVFIGCLGAQTSKTETTTTTTTMNNNGNPVNLDGTLVDQGCYTTHSREKQTNSDQNSTTTTVTTKETTECPVTTSTTSFGLMTPDGHVVRLDDSGNRRVVEMMKSDRGFGEDVNGHRPVRVHVVAMPNGDVMVVKDIKRDNQ